MTDRLYYADSYARRFTGRVIETTREGDRPAVVLDRSAFYPTSGGQPHDTGRLGSARVEDVTTREGDSAVLHVLSAPLEGDAVEGDIDWARRFDHMQQHSGQHILSQAFLRTMGAETIGFHLGAGMVSIDLSGPDLAEGRVAEAEALANQIAGSNAAVRAWFPEPGELTRLALRKLPDVAGPVRVVAIGDFDVSACGGTHVAATGEVGHIAVQQVERLKRGARIQFLCGHRAQADYARKSGIVRQLATALTCSPEELSGSVHRLHSALQDARRQLAAVRERELDAEAALMLRGSIQRGAIRVVRAGWEQRAIEEVKGLALRITSSPGVVGLFGVGGPKAQLLFARSEETATDLEPVFRKALELLGGGKGGGGRMLQGAAGPAGLPDIERVLDASEAALR